MILGVATRCRIGCGKSKILEVFFLAKTVLNYTANIEMKFSDFLKDSFIHQASYNIASLLEWYFLRL
jgi:hypothetical protein